MFLISCSTYCRDIEGFWYTTFSLNITPCGFKLGQWLDVCVVWWPMLLTAIFYKTIRLHENSSLLVEVVNSHRRPQRSLSCCTLKLCESFFYTLIWNLSLYTVVAHASDKKALRYTLRLLESFLMLVTRKLCATRWGCLRLESFFMLVTRKLCSIRWGCLRAFSC